MTITCAELVHGQENLDRMKQEIDFIIKLCLNSVWPKEFSERSSRVEDHIIFGNAGASWRIERVGQGYDILFSWKLIGGILSENVVTWQRISPPATSVQPMYQALPLFLKGMLEHFPQLEDRLQTFVTAAKVKF